MRLVIDKAIQGQDREITGTILQFRLSLHMGQRFPCGEVDVPLASVPQSPDHLWSDWG